MPRKKKSAMDRYTYNRNSYMKRTKEQVIRAIYLHKGRIFNIAIELEVCSTTVMKYARRWPEVREAIKEARGRLLDKAECALYAAVDREEPWAVKFVLRTKGKHRGYVLTPPAQERLQGGQYGGLVTHKHEHLLVDVDKLSVEAKRLILSQIRAGEVIEALPAPEMIDVTPDVSTTHDGDEVDFDDDLED